MMGANMLAEKVNVGALIVYAGRMVKAERFIRRHTLRPPPGWRNPILRKEQ